VVWIKTRGLYGSGEIIWGVVKDSSEMFSLQYQLKALLFVLLVRVFFKTGLAVVIMMFLCLLSLYLSQAAIPLYQLPPKCFGCVVDKSYNYLTHLL
jgi:uncharacterized membrane protein